MKYIQTAVTSGTASVAAYSLMTNCHELCLLWIISTNIQNNPNYVLLLFFFSAPFIEDDQFIQF